VALTALFSGKFSHLSYELWQRQKKVERKEKSTETHTTEESKEHALVIPS